MADPDPLGEASAALAPGQVAAVAAALTSIGDRLRALEEGQREVRAAIAAEALARAQVWSAIAALVTGRPGQIVGVGLAVVGVSAAARALGVDLAWLQGLIGP